MTSIQQRAELQRRIWQIANDVRGAVDGWDFKQYVLGALFYRGRNQRSALFKTMFLAFRSAGAKDWHSNLTIALDHNGVQHRLQFHHIFPKAVLTKAGVISREADDIANLAFIGGKTNRVISDKPPKEYLAFFAAKSGEEGFSVQEIPLDPELLDTPAYKKFLEVRRERIATRLNVFITG